jgi:ketosteroid isomerase-like protein
MKTLRTGLISIVGIALLTPVSVFADAADDVIAITKAQWAAEIADKGSAEIMKDVADEYTEFNSGLPTRVDGKALATRMQEAASQGSGSLILAEMMNSKVQVYGSTAVLTYNFAGAAKSADGEIENIAAKSTRVYVKGKDGWKLVHANFAPVGGDDN